jgi:hypothetical protein
MPQPFCYAIRRPQHYPEGTIAIEVVNGSGPPEPVYALVRQIDSFPMSFRLNAATSVEFHGQRFLHAYMAHSFASSSGPKLQLAARTRQFSSFLMLVGKISSANTFDPQCGIILQNKDELRIPLMLEALPTPKEFRDAIESLSPEQQRFARAYRTMQLEGSVFAVCIIQLKPQLEKLLNLPDDSLTKEIKLTQDLMEMFITYQIPSDLLTYDGDGDAPVVQKLAAVRQHVTSIREMLNEQKSTELAEAAQEKEFAQAMELNRLAARDEKKKKKAAAPPMFLSRSMAAPSAPSSDMGFFAGGGGAPCPPMAAAAPSPPPPPMAAAAPPPMAVAAAAAAATPPAPQPASVEPAQPPSKIQKLEVSSDVVVDFTAIPTRLDKSFESLDVDSALRPTSIKIAPGSWTKLSQKSLLSREMDTTNLPAKKSGSNPSQEGERDRAFDLLDALSRSGVLSIDAAELHVMVAATHCFDKSVVDTVIQDNVNPIEKVERSSLIVATTIQDVPAAQLVKAAELERLAPHCSGLLEG